jgi:hypothetical protein
VTLTRVTDSVRRDVRVASVRGKLGQSRPLLVLLYSARAVATLYDLLRATRNGFIKRCHRRLLLRLLLPTPPAHRPPGLIQTSQPPGRGLPLAKNPRTPQMPNLLQPQSHYHVSRAASERRQPASPVCKGAALKVTEPRRNRKTLFYGRLPGCTRLGSASLLTSAPCPACGPP